MFGTRDRGVPRPGVVRHSVDELRTRRRAVGRLLAWSLPESIPAALSGVVIARALDAGFLAGRPGVGFAWLILLVPAAVVGALGVRQVNHAVADVVEPFRDDLVRRVVRAALHRSAAPGTTVDRGAVARLTHQVETVRDSYAGLVLVARGFLITTAAALLGLASLAPVLFPLVLPPMLIGLTVFAVSMRQAVAWQRAYLLADEHLAGSAGAVLGAVRDVTACRAEERAAAMVDPAISAQAQAERALARMAALRSVSVAVSGWVPLIVVLASAGWLTGRGVTAGVLVGALTYLSQAVLPVLDTFVRTVGSGGLRYAVTLDRILTATAPTTEPANGGASAITPVPAGHALLLRNVTFRYAPAADPVLRGLTLAIPAGDHLALVGPSGVGKSTLAGLLCGALQPDEGEIRLGGVPMAAVDPAELPRWRTLIPQEAYVFTGSLIENLTYLNPRVSLAEIVAAIDALGVEGMITQIGGLGARVSPQRLSAGQRQLVALLRTYLSPAPITVLDEATCHLDAASESRVERAFAARPGTLIVIAHRMSSATRAARILVLDGERTALGSHDELLRDCQLYRDLTGYWLARPPARSQPAGVAGEPDGLDARPRPGFAGDAGQMVVHGPHAHP